MKIVGSPVSPYVRKVLVALHHKGVDYEIDPITPFFGNDEFSAISPLRRIPVLIDGAMILNDSTVIAEYIDEAYPEPAMMPASPADRARSRWIEEYADSRLGDLCIWGLFYPRVVAPYVFKQAPDEAAVAKVIDADLPAALDWIEGQAPADGFLFGSLGIADVAVACPLRNAAIAGCSVDPARWPRTAAWIARVAETPAFARTVAFEQAILTSRAPDRAAALTAAGATVSAKSYAADQPRASIMLR